MANYNKTKLTCNDLQKFTEILNRIPFIKYLDFEFKDGTAFIETRNSLPDKEIEQISRENPDLVFTARYLFESEEYSTDHIVEYRNGESNEISLEANYGVITMNIDFMKCEYIRSHMGNHYNKLLNRAIEIFKRIDITKENENGVRYIDFIGNITLTVEDEDYQMQLSKDSSFLKVKCFIKEKIITTKLVPVEDKMMPF